MITETRYVIRRKHLYCTGFVEPGRAGSFDPSSGKTLSKDGESLDPWSSPMHECVRLASAYSRETHPDLFVQVAPLLWAIFEPHYRVQVVSPCEKDPEGEWIVQSNSQMAYTWENYSSAESIARRMSDTVVEARTVKVEERGKRKMRA